MQVDSLPSEPPGKLIWDKLIPLLRGHHPDSTLFPNLMQKSISKQISILIEKLFVWKSLLNDNPWRILEKNIYFSNNAEYKYILKSINKIFSMLIK